MHFLKENSTEWHAAWAALAQVEGPSGMRAYNGESWQYMGSVKTSTGWAHEFRHRWHSALNSRSYRQIPASKGWAPLEKKKIKQ